MSKADDQETEGLLTAVGHPLRRKILKEMRNGGTGESVSPSALARALEEPVAGVSYHMRVLGECEMVRLVATRQIRGALQHFYRTTARLNHPLIQAALGPEEEEAAQGKQGARRLVD